MSRLVAYGDDSDEDDMTPGHSPEGSLNIPESSQASVSNETKNQDRMRRDSDVMFDDAELFNRSSSRERDSGDDHDREIEPPPPKRPHDAHSPSPSAQSPKMTQVASSVSLVNYAPGIDTRGDEFDRAEEAASPNSRNNSQPPSVMEPRPPARVTVDDSDSEGESERLIDRLVEEGKAVMKNGSEAASSEPSTPRPDHEESPRALETQEENKVEDDEMDFEVILPPYPQGEVEPSLQEKFERMFAAKASPNKLDMNAQLQQRKDFLNPSCYETFIEKFNLDEKGSNFRPELFDPHGFPESCYYEHLAEEQRRVTEQNQKHAKAGGPVAKKKV